MIPAQVIDFHSCMTMIQPRFCIHQHPEHTCNYDDKSASINVPTANYIMYVHSYFTCYEIKVKQQNKNKKKNLPQQYVLSFSHWLVLTSNLILSLWKTEFSSRQRAKTETPD